MPSLFTLIILTTIGAAVQALQEENDKINRKLNQTIRMAETGMEKSNKSNNEILRRIDRLEEKLYNRGNRVFSLEQNKSCLDTIHRTKNSSIGKSRNVEENFKFCFNVKF